MKMNTLDRVLQCKNKHVIVQRIEQYDHKNKIKISSSKNDKFLALSIYLLTDYSTGNG